MGKLKRESSCSTMAVKCYSKQLISGEDGLVAAIKSISSDEINVIAIKHDKSLDKVHWHIIMRGGNREKRMRAVSTLKRLSIVFRDKIDDELWNKHAVETVGDFSSYATYLLHMTEEAKEEGKEQYDKTDFITNLSDEEIDMILAGYRIRKNKKVDANSYNDLAREAGYNLKNFDEFIKDLGVTNMSSKTENAIRECYLDGASKRTKENKRILRFAVQIKIDKLVQAEKYIIAAEEALSNKITVKGIVGETLATEPDTEAIIAVVENPDESKLNTLKYLSDDSICDYGTGRKRYIWAGDTLIVIAGAVLKNQERFFQCVVKDGKLICTAAPTIRLSDSERDRLIENFKGFKARFDEALNEYYAEYSGKPISLDDLNL